MTDFFYFLPPPAGSWRQIQRAGRILSHTQQPRFLSPPRAGRYNKCPMPAGQAMRSFLERTRAAAKIIVIDFGFLGDSIHLVPALWEIKRHYPGAELHTLSAPVGAELLALAPCVDRPWAFPLTAKSPPWWKHWDILWALRRQRFDGPKAFLERLAGRRLGQTRGAGTAGLRATPAGSGRARL